MVDEHISHKAEALLQAEYSLEQLMVDQELPAIIQELRNRFQAHTASLLVTNQQLQREITEREQIENFLRVQRDLSLALGSARGLTDTLSRLLEATCQIEPIDSGAVYLVDGKAGRLNLIFHRGVSAEFVGYVSCYDVASDGLARMALAGKPVYGHYAQVAPPREYHPEEGLRGVAVIPVRYEGQTIATLNLASHTHDEIPPSTRSSLESIAAQIGGVINRVKAEEALRASEERYALAARGANDGLWDWDLGSHHLYFSPRWKSMLGCSEEKIGPALSEWFSRIHPDDLECLKQQIIAHLEGHSPHLKVEYRILHQDGAYRWMLCRGLAVWGTAGYPCRMAGSQTDITARKQVEEQLRYDSTHDPLTGLPNRAEFMKRLQQMTQRAQKDPGYLFAILFVDLDRFKMINDSLGHVAGDQLLITIARRLEGCTRSKQDTVARFGGDEFTILLDEIEQVGDATNVAHRVQDELAAPIELGSHKIVPSASIGIAVSSDYHQPDDMLRDADTAMYQAKARGRARYELFEVGMHAQVLANLHLTADLQRAIELWEFEVYYQPIIAMADFEIIGAEALIRWRHPRFGLLSANGFVPLAEETGLIEILDTWVLREACQQNKLWQEAGYPPLRIGVNVSVSQLKRRDLLELVYTVLQTTGLEAQWLELQLTREVTDLKGDINLPRLNRLKEIGVQISIDNFGVFSSMGLLERFAIDILKIDRSLIDQTPKNKKAAAITTAIINLAHSLELRVIAEGVEKEEQLAFLHQQQCDAVQGFWFSPPLSASDFTGLLAARQGK